MSERICVLAWEEPGVTGVSRGEKLHIYEDARLMADELNREWPNICHWGAGHRGRADSPRRPGRPLDGQRSALSGTRPRRVAGSNGADGTAKPTPASVGCSPPTKPEVAHPERSALSSNRHCEERSDEAIQVSSAAYHRR
jgi:hypothetical protein